MTFPDRFVEKFLDRDLESDVDRAMVGLEFAQILELVRLEGPILDMGFGHGVVCGAILEGFGSCDVVEVSQSLCDVASARHPDNLTIHHSSFEDFDPPHRYGTVLATGVLHHLEDPELVLRRVASWIVPGGKVIISVPNRYSVHRALGVALGIEDSIESISDTGIRSGVKQVYSLATLSESVRRAGLRVVRPLPSFVKFEDNESLGKLAEGEHASLFDLARLVPIEFHATLILECELIP